MQIARQWISAQPEHVAVGYPGHILDDAEAVAYFEGFFDWYNHKHYHSDINYVTPQQVHKGLRGKTVKQRLSQYRAQRLRHRDENQ